MPQPSEFRQCDDCGRLIGDASNEHQSGEDFCFVESCPGDPDLVIDCYSKAIPRLRALVHTGGPYAVCLRDKAAAHALSWLGADKAFEEANKLVTLLGYEVPR